MQEQILKETPPDGSACDRQPTTMTRVTRPKKKGAAVAISGCDFWLRDKSINQFKSMHILEVFTSRSTLFENF
jgi:hypothetical protein